MRKRVPQTAERYAQHFYDWEGTGTEPVTMSALAIVNARCRAFVDGARWARRQPRKRKRRARR